MSEEIKQVERRLIEAAEQAAVAARECATAAVTARDGQDACRYARAAHILVEAAGSAGRHATFYEALGSGFAVEAVRAGMDAGVTAGLGIVKVVSAAREEKKEEDEEEGLDEDDDAKVVG